MLTLAAADTIQAVAGTTTAITYTISGMEYSVALGEVYKVDAQGQVATSAGVLYTVPASTVAFVSLVNLTNTTGSAVSGVILYRGGTAAANQLTGSLTIPANGTLTLNQFGEWQMIDNLGNLLTAGTNIFDTTAVADITPLALSAAGVASTAARRDHTHQAAGGIAALTAATAGINSSETIVLSATIPANLIKVGTSFHITAGGVCTSSAANVSNFRMRIGTAGSSADVAPAVVTPTAATSGTAIPFLIELFAVCRTAGSSGTIIGHGDLTNNGVTGVSASATVVGQLTSTVAINTTVQNIIQISYVAAASTTTCTFHNAMIEIVKE